MTDKGQRTPTDTPAAWSNVLVKAHELWTRADNIEVAAYDYPDFRLQPRLMAVSEKIGAAAFAIYRNFYEKAGQKTESDI